MNRALPPSAPSPQPASRAAPRKAAAKALAKTGARAADVVGKPPRESTIASPSPAATATTAKTARKAAVAASPAKPKPARPRRSTATPASATATDAARPRRVGRAHYHVYVIELSSAVLAEPRFLRSNPGYLAGKPCVYVGMTGLDPDVRFDKHKAGIQHNRYVLRYGLRLLPDLYEGFNPMRYAEAAAREVEIGIDLRANGWGVWQA